MPEAISPELATLINQPPENDLWLHEIKWDGYRFICIVKNNKVKFYTRHQKDWTHLFPKNSNAIKKLLKNMGL